MNFVISLIITTLLIILAIRVQVLEQTIAKKDSKILAIQRAVGALSSEFKDHVKEEHNGKEERN